MARPTAKGGLIAKELLEIAPRSILVNVQPAPANLTERRAVLRMLQKHGPVDMFRKRTDSASFDSIMSSTASANKLVEKSPITFEFISDGKFHTKAAAWNSREITSPIQPIERPAGQIPHKATTSLITQKTFELHISPSDKFDHRRAITQSPLYDAWPDRAAAGKESFVYNTLKAVVPSSMATEGLCDWDTGYQLSNGSSGARQAEAFFYENRTDAVRRRKAAESSMSSLAEAVRKLAAERKRTTIGVDPLKTLHSPESFKLQLAEKTEHIQQASPVEDAFDWPSNDVVSEPLVDEPGETQHARQVEDVPEPPSNDVVNEPAVEETRETQWTRHTEDISSPGSLNDTVQERVTENRTNQVEEISEAALNDTVQEQLAENIGDIPHISPLESSPAPILQTNIYQRQVRSKLPRPSKKV